MRAGWPIAGLLTMACGPKLDPLEPMRGEVAIQRQREPGPAPHLYFAIAEPAASELVHDLLEPEKPRLVPMMMGATVTVTVDLDPLGFEVSPGPHLRIDAAGRFDATLSSLLGKRRLADAMGFRGHLEGGVRFAIEPADGGQRISMVPATDDPWTSSIHLESPTGVLDDEALAGPLEALTASALGEPVVLGLLPDRLGLALHRLALEPTSPPTLGVWLLAAPPGSAPPRPTPTEGFAIATNDDALLAGARAYFTDYVPRPSWRVEPRALHVTEDRFEAIWRLHKVARRTKWREYRIEGTIDLQEDLRIRVTGAEERDRKGFGGSLIGPLIRHRVKRSMLRFDQRFPATFLQRAGDRSIRWSLERLHSAEAGLIIEGAVRVESE